MATISSELVWRFFFKDSLNRYFLSGAFTNTPEGTSEQKQKTPQQRKKKRRKFSYLNERHVAEVQSEEEIPAFKRRERKRS